MNNECSRSCRYRVFFSLNFSTFSLVSGFALCSQSNTNDVRLKNCIWFGVAFGYYLLIISNVTLVVIRDVCDSFIALTNMQICEFFSAWFGACVRLTQSATRVLAENERNARARARVFNLMLSMRMGDAIDTNVKFKRSQNECFKSYFFWSESVRWMCLCVYLHYTFLLVVSACTWSQSNSCTTHFCRSSKRDIFTIVNAFGASVVAVLISSYHQEQVQSMRFAKIHNNKWERRKKKSVSLRVSAYKWMKMKRKKPTHTQWVE